MQSLYFLKIAVGLQIDIDIDIDIDSDKVNADSRHATHRGDIITEADNPTANYLNITLLITVMRHK